MLTYKCPLVTKSHTPKLQHDPKTEAIELIPTLEFGEVDACILLFHFLEEFAPDVFFSVGSPAGSALHNVITEIKTQSLAEQWVLCGLW